MTGDEPDPSGDEQPEVASLPTPEPESASDPDGDSDPNPDSDPDPDPESPAADPVNGDADTRATTVTDTSPDSDPDHDADPDTGGGDEDDSGESDVATGTPGATPETDPPTPPGATGAGAATDGNPDAPDAPAGPTSPTTDTGTDAGVEAETSADGDTTPESERAADAADADTTDAEPTAGIEADTSVADAGDGNDPPEMCRVYRHDIHKLRGRSHDAAADEFAGVQVNDPVPLGADADAALLSRPRGDPEQTVANHASPRRLSLLTGSPTTTDDSPTIDKAVRRLARLEHPTMAHAAWLSSDVAALFNESVYYPYTSAKYHVLLTAALLSNYRVGAAFDDLWLVADPPATTPTPHRTVLHTGPVSLRITHDPGDRPAARLGTRPARSFADVWARLPDHPLATDSNRRAMILDAQLRRIRAWSTALQFIEDYVATVERIGGSLQ